MRIGQNLWFGSALMVWVSPLVPARAHDLLGLLRMAMSFRIRSLAKLESWSGLRFHGHLVEDRVYCFQPLQELSIHSTDLTQT